MFKALNKLMMIASREYFAYVKTVGFWLSLLTVPVFIIIIVLVPAFLIGSDPVERVAVVDLTGQNIGAEVSRIVDETAKKVPLPENLTQAAKDNPMIAKAIEQSQKGSMVRVTDSGLNLSQAVTIETIEPLILSRFADKKSPADAYVTAYVKEGEVAYVIFTRTDQSRVLSQLKSPLRDHAFVRKLKSLGIDEETAQILKKKPLDLVSRSTQNTISDDKKDDKAIGKRGFKAEAILGALTGYLTWIAVISSSILLLSSVIEEKSSRVLEVLLSSTSTETLLGGKVLGVLMVLATVVLIWVGVGIAGLRFGLGLMTPENARDILAILSSFFAASNLLLLGAYLIGGYVMYGVFFAVVGAFCDTPKEAQAIIGPTMIVLMIPMMSLQVALVSPEQPFVKSMSLFPLFSPFLMPVRMTHLELWEIIVSLSLMAVICFGLLRLGRKAFKQGALGTGKLSFGTLFKAMGSKE